MLWHQQHGEKWRQYWMFLGKITENACPLLQLSNMTIVTIYCKHVMLVKQLHRKDMVSLRAFNDEN